MKQLWFLILMFISMPAWSVQDPQVLVEETTRKITRTLDMEQEQIKARPVYLYEIVDKIVLPHFDFERMSSWALGKYRRKADAAQRDQFTREFRELLVRTYAKALNDNYDQAIDMLPMRGKVASGEVVVRTEVQQSAGFPIPIDYKMYLKDDGWKVYDVSVDGISLVANYRTSFAREIRKDGLPKFIERLASRNQEARAE